MSITDIANAKYLQHVAPDDTVFRHQAYVTESQLAKELLGQIRQLQIELSQKETLIGELNQQIDVLKYQVVWMAKEIFGRKSEATQNEETSDRQAEEQNDGDLEPTEDDAQEENTQEPDPPEKPKKRGKKKGEKGYGRRRRVNLPFEEIVHDLAHDDKFCLKCALPFEALSFTEDSEQVHWEVKIIRHIHRRKCYKPTCSCKAVPGIVSAPPVAKMIPKGMLTCRRLLGATDFGKVSFSKTAVQNPANVRLGGVWCLSRHAYRRVEENQSPG